MESPLILNVSEVAYIAIVLFGVAMWPHLGGRQRLLLAAFAVSVVANTAQLALRLYGINNHWLNTIWPHFQGGLFLATFLDSHKIKAVAAAILYAGWADWAELSIDGMSLTTNALIEMSIFGGIVYLAYQSRIPILSTAMMVYAIPGIVLAPILAYLAQRQAWEAWLGLFQIVHLGRIAGIVLCAWWLWKSSCWRRFYRAQRRILAELPRWRPAQYELWAT